MVAPGVVFFIIENAQQILAHARTVNGGSSIASLDGSTHLFVADATQTHLGATAFQSI
jgi:hypothetical protein